METPIIKCINAFVDNTGMIIPPMVQAEAIHAKVREFKLQEEGLQKLIEKETTDILDYLSMKKANVEAISALLECAKAGRLEAERQLLQSKKREPPQTSISVGSPKVRDNENPSISLQHHSLAESTGREG